MGMADFLKDKTNRRNVLIGVISAILAVVLSLLMRTPPVAVDVAQVDQGGVEIAIEGEGKTRVREIYTVSAPITGRMDRITFESGDAVTAEETVLARIEPADPTFLDVRSAAQARADLDAAKAAVDLARAKLTRAEAERTFARSELKRAEELFQRANVSERALERAQLEERTRSAEVETARSDLSVALASLEAAKARLIQPTDQRGKRPDSCCVAVRSPISGQVLRVPDKSERVVTSGDPLIEVGNPADLEAVIDVLSTDAVKVKPGDAAFIQHWGGGDALAAVVSRVEPAGFMKISALGIEEQRVNVILNITAPPADWVRLGDQYRVEARIIVDDVSHVTRVPVSALYRRGEAWALFKLDGGRAREQVVEVGLRSDTYAEIKSGAGVGDTVVVHPGNKIKDGVRVRARES